MEIDRASVRQATCFALDDAAIAFELAAAVIGSVLPLREKHLQLAFKLGLERRLATTVDTGRKLVLPNWLGESGPVDIVVPDRNGVPYRHHAKHASAVFELKWAYTNKLAEVLWDAFKVVQATIVEGVRGAYLVAGAPESYWDKPAPCAELFAHGEHSPVELVERNPIAFADLVENSAGLPLRVPSLLRTIAIGESTVEWNGMRWLLRAAAVEPASETWVELIDRWPSGSQPFADLIAAKAQAGKPFQPPDDPPHYDDPDEAPFRWWRFTWYPGDLEFVDGDAPPGVKSGRWVPASADELLEALEAQDETAALQRKRVFGYVQSGHSLPRSVEIELTNRGLLIKRPTKKHDINQARDLVRDLLASDFKKGELVAAVMELTEYCEHDARELIHGVVSGSA